MATATMRWSQAELRKNDPVKIGDVLAKMIKDSGLAVQFDQAKIWEHWPELAGKRLAAHGRPLAVKDQTLIIEADSPVWLHRYAFHKWEVLKRVNRMAGYELVSDIFVKLAEESP